MLLGSTSLFVLEGMVGKVAGDEETGSVVEMQLRHVKGSHEGTPTAMLYFTRTGAAMSVLSRTTSSVLRRPNQFGVEASMGGIAGIFSGLSALGT